MCVDYIFTFLYYYLCVRFIQGPFAKFMDSPYYPELELCGGAVMVFFFFKYLPWQAMHFLHFSGTPRFQEVGGAL
jgi:hypothetical protein